VPEDAPEEGTAGAGTGPAGGVADRIADLVTTTLDVGASVARSVAAATTTRELPERGETPLDDIVTFGAAAAGNIVNRAVDAVRSAERLAKIVTPTSTERGAAPAPQPPSAARPRVTRGATLRMPLLVENTGSTPTTELTFEASAVTRLADSEGEGIDPEQVTFTPATLVIGARDFEKLTVRVHTTDETAPAVYRATVTGGGGWFSTVIEFEVHEPG
jgi:hypothetical protein